MEHGDTLVTDHTEHDRPYSAAFMAYDPHRSVAGPQYIRGGPSANKRTHFFNDQYSITYGPDDPMPIFETGDPFMSQIDIIDAHKRTLREARAKRTTSSDTGHVYTPDKGLNTAYKLANAMPPSGSPAYATLLGPSYAMRITDMHFPRQPSQPSVEDGSVTTSPLYSPPKTFPLPGPQHAVYPHQASTSYDLTDLMPSPLQPMAPMALPSPSLVTPLSPSMQSWYLDEQESANVSHNAARYTSLDKVLYGCQPLSSLNPNARPFKSAAGDYTTDLGNMDGMSTHDRMHDFTGA